MHRLLARQLHKLGIDGHVPPTAEQWQAVLERVSGTYDSADRDRYLMERSLEIGSREMQVLHDQARAVWRQDQSKNGAILSAIQNAVHEGILLTDEHAEAIVTNRRFFEIWGLGPEEFANMRFGEVMARVRSTLVDPDGFVSRIKELQSQPDAAARDMIEFTDGRLIERYSLGILAEGRGHGR